jgi:tRNA nucleotidyltransferase/poly(A) polymerase
MKTEGLYGQILDICKENFISKPYVVGGVPRDITLGMAREFEDIDLTTNHPDVARLAITIAYTFDELFKLFPDGHVAVYFDKYTLDFSSNFLSEGAIEYIDKELGIKDEFYHEVYSRDFTMNTLHMDIETKEITDPTGRALEDLDKKIIKTCVPPEITISDDPKRAFRAISFAARFGFDLDPELVSFIKENRNNFKTDGPLFVKPTSISKVIARALKASPEVTLKHLMDMDLLTSVPLVGRFKDELIKRRLIKYYLDNI